MSGGDQNSMKLVWCPADRAHQLAETRQHSVLRVVMALLWKSDLYILRKTVSFKTERYFFRFLFQNFVTHWLMLAFLNPPKNSVKADMSCWLLPIATNWVVGAGFAPAQCLF